MSAVLILNATKRKFLSCYARTLQSCYCTAKPSDLATGTDAEQRVLTVAIVGLPNAGKSTLVNRLIGTKISGVSSKRNTTISTQLGCFTEGSSQVLLYDTPGLVEGHVQGSPLERLRSAWATAAMVDQLLFIVDAERQVSVLLGHQHHDGTSPVRFTS